jgi:N-acetylglutamate synthase-like GNAT family acetyltransferase
VIGPRLADKRQGVFGIHVRQANDEDELVVQELLGQLGYILTVEEVRARLVLLATSSTDPVLLAAEDSSAVELIALHYATMLHHREPVARITALVVRDDVRGKGSAASWSRQEPTWPGRPVAAS